MEFGEPQVEVRGPFLRRVFHVASAPGDYPDYGSESGDAEARSLPAASRARLTSDTPKPIRRRQDAAMS